MARKHNCLFAPSVVAVASAVPASGLAAVLGLAVAGALLLPLALLEGGPAGPVALEQVVARI